MRGSARRHCKLQRIAWLWVMLFSGLSWMPVTGQEVPSKASSPPSAKMPSDRVKQYSDLAVEWMQEYLRIDTTNPPGNELRAAVFLKRILDKEGIENYVFEYAPGRADLWARVPHTSAQAKRPIILLNHMDVVTSDAAHWRVPPFSATIIGGAMYGRGAQDMKDEGLAQLVVMVMLMYQLMFLS